MKVTFIFTAIVLVISGISEGTKSIENIPGTTSDSASMLRSSFGFKSNYSINGPTHSEVHSKGENSTNGTQVMKRERYEQTFFNKVQKYMKKREGYVFQQNGELKSIGNENVMKPNYRTQRIQWKSLDKDDESEEDEEEGKDDEAEEENGKNAKDEDDKKKKSKKYSYFYVPVRAISKVKTKQTLDRKVQKPSGNQAESDLGTSYEDNESGLEDPQQPEQEGYEPQQGEYEQEQGDYQPQQEEGYEQEQGDYQPPPEGYEQDQGGYEPQQEATRSNHQQEQEGYEQDQGDYGPQQEEEYEQEQGDYQPQQEADQQEQGGYEQQEQENIRSYHGGDESVPIVYHYHIHTE